MAFAAEIYLAAMPIERYSTTMARSSLPVIVRGAESRHGHEQEHVGVEQGSSSRCVLSLVSCPVAFAYH